MKLEIIRWIALIVLIGFSGYTIYCARTENFIKSCRGVFSYKWGRQVTMDLYIGLLLFVFFIYLNEGSLTVTLLWLVPTLIFGNIIPLIYFFIFFEALSKSLA